MPRKGTKTLSNFVAAMDIQLSVDDEVQAFMQQETWRKGDTCTVPGCPETRIFARETAYGDHWAKYHLPEATLWQCIRCGRKFLLRTRATRHTRMVHHTEDSPRKMAVVNKFYVDPGTVAPPAAVRTSAEGQDLKPKEEGPKQEPWKPLPIGTRQPPTLWTIAWRRAQDTIRKTRERMAQERGLRGESSLVDYLYLIHS